MTNENLRYNSDLYHNIVFNFDYILPSNNRELTDQEILNYYYIDNKFLNLNHVFFESTLTSEEELLSSKNNYIINGINLTENSYFEFNYFIKNITINDIIKNISDNNYNDYNKFTEMKLLISDDESRYKINPFYLLIQIIKQNYFNNGSFMITSYLDEETNEIVTIKDLIFNIVGILFLSNEKYYNNFVKMHFFELFKNALISNDIKKFYLITNKDKQIKFKDVIDAELDEDEFKNQLLKYMSSNDITNFITENKILKYHYSFIRFAKYSALLNKFFSKNKLKDNDNYSLINFSESDGIIIKFNFLDYFTNDSSYDLINKIIDEDDESSYLNKISTYFTNICIKIQNIREELKTIIQQYNFIGTKKVVDNILYDFFIKNYSKRSDWGYLNLNTLSGDDDLYLRSVNNLVNGTLSGGFRKNDSFSISIIEYYDKTNYLNIDSQLPDVKIGQKIIGYEEIPSAYIGSDYLLASTLVDAPIYEDIYVPCSNFVTNYNKRFWEDSTVLIDSLTNITIDNENKFKEYDKFYNNFIKVEAIGESLTKDQVIPFLERLWNIFALSGISNNTELLDEYVFYKEYLKNLSSKKYLNLENTIFPTVAVQQDLRNLIEIGKYDAGEILAVAKYYYESVADALKEYSIKILNKYDESGIPIHYNDYSLTTYHGYSTKYELSKKQLQYSQKNDKIYSVDGPWVYSILQRVLYERNLSRKYLL